MNVSCKNLTPAEVVERLVAAGINREPRVLTDWRARGVLPPLKRIGRGRGRGTISVWPESVVEQAAAAHYLMAFYDRSEYAVTGLWLSGFEIDPHRVKSAWLDRIDHDRDRMQRQSLMFRSGTLGLVKRWGRQMPNIRTVPNFFRDFIEWRFDESESDSEIIRGHIVDAFGERESLGSGIEEPTAGSYAMVEEIWEIVQPEELYIPESAMAFVGTMTTAEISELTPLFKGLRRLLQTASGSPPGNGRLVSLRFHCRLMADFLGPVAIGLTKLRREEIHLPLFETFSVLRNFAIGVQWADKIGNRNNDISLTLEEQKRWVIARRKLRRLWSEVL